MGKIFKWIGIIVVAFIVLGVIIGATGGGDNSSNSNNNNNTSNTANTTDSTDGTSNTEEEESPEDDNEAENQQEKSYVKVFELSGSGAKKSEPFTITGDRFRVKYNCKEAGVCSGYVRKAGGSALDVDLFVNTTEQIEDESIVYKNGEFYIDMNATVPWTVIVEDYK